MRAKILVIDDEKSLRSILVKVLTKEGYDVLPASSGEAAIELARKEKVDMALVDLKMPGIDGIETIRRLKEIDKGIINIIVTAYGEMESVKEATNLGVFDYITKPFDLDYIKALVKHLLVDVRPKALPFSEDMKATFTGELTQRQVLSKRLALLKEIVDEKTKALKKTSRDLDRQIANLYEGLTAYFAYKVRSLVTNVYFVVVIICIFVGILSGYLYTAWSTRQLYRPWRKPGKEVTLKDFYEKLDKIEYWMRKDVEVEERLLREREAE